MKLYFSPTSPFVRKVMLVLYLRNRVEGVQLVPGSGTPTQPNKLVVGANPLGRIPCLVTDDGKTIHDSRVITRYLDELTGGGLYPPGDFAVLTREAMADGVMESGVLSAYEHRLRPAAQRHQPVVDGYQAKIARSIAAFEADADAVTDGAIRIDHIALASALGYLDFRFSGTNWRKDAPKIAGWFDDFRETPAMLATAPREMA
ncbi:MAG: glutathione S-transferase family protein [Pseudomonadota bacterium]